MPPITLTTRTWVQQRLALTPDELDDLIDDEVLQLYEVDGDELLSLQAVLELEQQWLDEGEHDAPYDTEDEDEEDDDQLASTCR